MPRGKKNPALESAPLEPKPKRRKTAAKATEPTPVSEILPQTPIAAIIAEHEAKAQAEPDHQLPESVGVEKRSHAATILAERPAFRQVPENYFRVASHEREGIRVFKDTVMKGGQKIGVAGVQFADNRPPSEAEKQLLRDQGHFYKIEESLWKRESRPGEPLGDPAIGAIRAADELARQRRGIER